MGRKNIFDVIADSATNFRLTYEGVENLLNNSYLIPVINEYFRDWESRGIYTSFSQFREGLGLRVGNYNLGSSSLNP